MGTRDLRLQKAQQAIDSIGLGFDITQDICFDNIKRGPRLVQINERECRGVKIPGGISIPNVPNSIKCLGGESHRIQSEVLSFDKMSEHFNMAMRLTDKTPSGHFCASFRLSGNWIKDTATIRSLAYDGCFITRYAFELERYDGASDHVKEAMPLTWDPQALARFIERFGTHVVVGVRMGAKDVLYVRQEDPSHFQPTELLKFLKDKASKRFTDFAENHCLTADEVFSDNKENIVVIYDRRGGSNEMMRHSEWLDTVDSEPDVIALFLLPLSTFLSGTHGFGFLSHAINLYVKYKPPIEELHQFLEFQIPRQWAPVPGETSSLKNQLKSELQLGILGPKLYINTIPVDVGNRPVTGLRLQLEGTRSNRLTIHLQHLASLPKLISFSDKEKAYLSCLHEKVKWNYFSYVCTAPIESGDSLSIVTGAQLLVERNCLRLRLRFSKVIGATLQKSPEWDQSCGLVPQWEVNCISGCTFIRRKKEPKPGEVTISSLKDRVDRPSPVNTPTLERFVDTSETVRGPNHSPGHWVVSGAGLSIQNGRINLRVKYSLFNFVNKRAIPLP